MALRDGLTDQTTAPPKLRSRKQGAAIPLEDLDKRMRASIKADNKFVSKQIDANADALAAQIKAAEGS